MKVQLCAVGFELKIELEKYANSKLSAMSKALPRKLRGAASCQAEFMQTKHNGIKQSTCTVTIIVDDEIFQAKETTQHMYAALDIAAVHIEQQLKAYAMRVNPKPSTWVLP